MIKRYRIKKCIIYTIENPAIYVLPCTLHYFIMKLMIDDDSSERFSMSRAVLIRDILFSNVDDEATDRERRIVIAHVRRRVLLLT